MGEFLTLTLALMAGALLGAIFIGGLWWTVPKGILSKQPALWFLVSLVLRTGIVLTGFYLVSGGHWDRLLACLAGFTVARFIVMRLTGRTAEYQNSATREAGHAPES